MKRAAAKEFKRFGRFFVYILECRDGTYYTGYTNDLEKRLKRHNDGLASKYTRARLPVRLAWSKEYKQFQSAFKIEMAIKRLTRSQKESLVKGKRLDKLLTEAKIYGQTGQNKRPTSENRRFKGCPVGAREGRKRAF